MLAAFALSACSSTSTYKGVYEGGQTVDPLEVPPDLSIPDGGNSVIPGGNNVNSYLGYQETLTTHGKDNVLHDFKNMRFVRDGALFWLEVKDSNLNVWNSMREFWTRLGFKIVNEQPAIGLMQTNWKENLVDIPSNWFSRFIGKIYSAETMDSYRIRFEYDEVQQITRVFIAHQGVREVADSEVYDALTSVKSKWIKRPSEPELEAEMLMRFMAFRGMDESQAKEEIAQTKAVEKAVVSQTGDGYVLQYAEAFPRAWRLVGIAMDRMGMLIEDRNRSAGVYYIQLPESFELADTSSLFSSSKKPSKDKYLLTLEDKGETTLVTLKARGEVGADLREVSKKILDDIKSNL